MAEQTLTQVEVKGIRIHVAHNLFCSVAGTTCFRLAAFNIAFCMQNYNCRTKRKFPSRVREITFDEIQVWASSWLDASHPQPPLQASENLFLFIQPPTRFRTLLLPLIVSAWRWFQKESVSTKSKRPPPKSLQSRALFYHTLQIIFHSLPPFVLWKLSHILYPNRSWEQFFLCWAKKSFRLTPHLFVWCPLYWTKLKFKKNSS